MSTNVRPHNLTLTDEVWSHIVEHHGARGASAALEAAYRAAHGMPPRPAVEERGRFVAGVKRKPRT